MASRSADQASSVWPGGVHEKAGAAEACQQRSANCVAGHGGLASSDGKGGGGAMCCANSRRDACPCGEGTHGIRSRARR